MAKGKNSHAFSGVFEISDWTDEPDDHIVKLFMGVESDTHLDGLCREHGWNAPGRSVRIGRIEVLVRCVLQSLKNGERIVAEHLVEAIPQGKKLKLTSTICDLLKSSQKIVIKKVSPGVRDKDRAFENLKANQDELAVFAAEQAIACVKANKALIAQALRTRLKKLENKGN